jgi:hypothetical protein
MKNNVRYSYGYNGTVPYGRLCRGEEIYLEKLNYIHNNPCVKGWNLAKTPEEYPHSSASNYLMGKGVYPVNILL